MKKYLLLLLLFKGADAFCQPVLPYKNPSLPIEVRANDLIKRMTPEEKFWQLFMIPGDLDNAPDSMYYKGIFGLQVSATSKGDQDDSVKVFCTIKNTGKTAGDEVVQLYTHDVLASVSQPVIQLKDFQRIHFNAGESKEIHFLITPEMLSILDKDLPKVVEHGNFEIMIGASSRDIRLKSILTVK